MKFSFNLRLTRKNNGVSIKQLADAIGVKPYTITDWEKGRSEPSISNLIKLAKYFNVSIDFLVGNTLNSTETYDKIVQLINNYQENNYTDELNKLLSDLSPKRQEKLINILKSIKKELFNK